MTFDSRENSKWVSVRATITGAVHIMIESLKRALTGLTQARVKLNHSTTVWIMTELSALAMAVKPIFAAVILPAELAQLVQQWAAEWEACRLQGGGRGEWVKPLPQRGAFFRFQVYERVGITISPDEVYEKIGKSVISVNKKANRCI